MSLIGELKRRGVIRVVLAYLAAVWLVVQVAATVFPAFGLPPAALTILIIALTVGLVPVTVLSWKFELTSSGVRSDTGATEDPGAARRQAQYLDRGITLLLVIGISYFAVDKFVFDPARDAGLIEAARQEGRADAIVGAYGDKSIAVLPFVNMSADPEQEYFSDGISEELLNLLAQIPELRVISRSTAFTFKGKEIVIPEVAKKLNVAHILEGSVRRTGNRIRVTAQLIDARTDTHLWSDTYDRELDDIFAIQDEISAKVVADLKLKLLGGPPKTEQIDPRAYELFLRGRHLLHKGVGDAEDEAEAVSLLEKAVELQPDWATGRSELLRAWFRLALRDQDDREKYQQLCWAELDRLAKIDRVGALTNGWLGWLTWRWRNDMQLAATYIERSSALDPNNTDVIGGVAIFLTALQRYDEAIAIFDYVVARDPGCTVCVNQLAFTLRARGRHLEAAYRLEALLEWHPPSSSLLWPLGVAWLVAGEPDKALAAFERPEMAPEQGSYGRMFALHDLGRIAEFESEFARYREASEASEESPEGIARIYAWTGNNDEAFLWLERMVERRGPGSAALVKTDLYEKLHSDPRWSAFLEKNGQAEDEIARIEFNPVYPPEVQAALTLRETHNEAER